VTITKLVISQGGRTLTLTGKGSNVQGQAVNNVTVFERQEAQDSLTGKLI
jgi:hypothetical protein